MFEGIGAAVLLFLAQHAAGGALDRVAGERIDAFRANRHKHDAFDRSLALALAQVERDHPGHARILADKNFLKNHAVVELAKFFSARDLPSADGLVVRWRDYRTHVPAAAPAIAAAFLAAIRDALIEHPEFRELIWFKRDAADSERLRAVGDDVAALRRLLEEMQRRPEVKPRPVNQLPADLPDFQGREEQVVRLREILTKGGGQAAVTAIGGMGGVGKSALAVHVAHLLEEEAPDGQVFIDLGGRTGTRFAPVEASPAAAPLTPVEAMIKVVAALDRERQVAKEEDAARRAYRAALVGRRALLLLDNAEDSAQVRPLLDWRAPTTMVVVTSRRTITAPGLQALDLDVMAAGEAEALLRSVLGARTPEEEELELIAERCGWLPLALRVAGTYLANNPQVKVDAYLDALADEKQRLLHLRFEDDVSLDVYAALALSARRLAEEKPELEARWHLLAVFPASFDAAAAAAVWEAEVDDALRGLGELRRRSMVLWDADDDRWRLHDLMRELAQLAPDGQDEAALAARLEAARAKHARHYCSVLAAATDSYEQGGEGVLAGLALYDLEQRNIAAGQVWAAARIEQEDATARLAADYADAGHMILNLRMTPSRWVEWLEAQRKACYRLGDQVGEADALANMGSAKRLIGEPQWAIEHLDQALVIFQDHGERRREGAVLGNLGSAWLDLGFPRYAIRLHQQALEISRHIRDQLAECQDLTNLGWAFLKLGKPRRALEFLDRALRMARHIGNPHIEGQVLGLSGSAQVDLGDLQQAVEAFEAWLGLASDIGDVVSQGNALYNLGVTKYELGEHQAAVERVSEALAIYEKFGAKHFIEPAREKLAKWGLADGAS